MTESMSTIGLIAGGKQFPVLVAKGVRSLGAKLVVAGFTGHTNMDVIQYAHVYKELKLGKLGQLIAFFKSHGVQKVIMAGTINKPKVMDVRHLDMRALKLIFKQKNKGDSAILGSLSAELELEGMTVIPAHTYLPEILTPQGVLTKREPSQREYADLRLGWKVAKELGRHDIGQCLVLREGIVAAVEALEGTDEAIKRGCSLGGSGCCVIKVFKPGQQEQIDLPSLGEDTIKTMVDGGATCLGIEAEKSLFFDKSQALALADKNGISVIGLSSEQFDS